MIEQEVRNWIMELCKAAGEEYDAAVFTDRLEQAPEIYKEIRYFAYHGNFLCEYTIQGYSIVDIMIWQMDHFKAHLDRDNFEIKHNQNKMVSTAFMTFLDMEKEPQKYVELLQSETGTDYPGKY